jgi:hypothetical protein
VHFDRALRQAQFIGDLLVQPPPRHSQQHCTLAG